MKAVACCFDGGSGNYDNEGAMSLFCCWESSGLGMIWRAQCVLVFSTSEVQWAVQAGGKSFFVLISGMT